MKFHTEDKEKEKYRVMGKRNKDNGRTGGQKLTINLLDNSHRGWALKQSNKCN